MDEMYAMGLVSPSRQATRNAAIPTQEEIEEVARVVEAQTERGKEDAMLLQKWNGKLLAEGFNLPEMEIEIERAVEQVEKDIKSAADLKDEKHELQQVVAQKAANGKIEETKQ